MPEGDPELPDEGLPEDVEEEDKAIKCPQLVNWGRAKVESLPDV